MFSKEFRFQLFLGISATCFASAIFSATVVPETLKVAEKEKTAVVPETLKMSEKEKAAVVP